MGNKRIPLTPEKVYHYYQHAVGNDNLFFQQCNYDYFLKKYGEHLHDIFETYCYCLLPNHFHFLVRVRPLTELEKPLQHLNRSKMSLSDKLAHKVGSFQNAYAKAINKQEGRRGALFMQSFGRKEITTPNYLYNVVHYIHKNAVHHGLVSNIEDWPHTSYHAYWANKRSRLHRQPVMDTFGSQAYFIESHKNRPIDERLILEMEDFFKRDKTP